MQNIGIASSLYVVPKVISYLGTKPLEIESGDKLYSIRVKISEGCELLSKRLGEKGCFILSGIIAENAWISALALSLLLQGRSMSKEDPIVAMSALIAGSTIVWLARFGLSHYMPDWFKWMTPRELRNEEVLPFTHKYQCPISLEIPEDVVGDPNGVTVYDKKHIVRWISESSSSPITREPMQRKDLQARPGLQALIDHRRYCLRQAELQEKE